MNMAVIIYIIIVSWLAAGFLGAISFAKCLKIKNIHGKTAYIMDNISFLSLKQKLIVFLGSVICILGGGITLVLGTIFYHLMR